MKVSPSLFVPPIKIVIVHRMVLSECCGLVWSKVRYGSFLVAFCEIVLGLFRTV